MKTSWITILILSIFLFGFTIQNNTPLINSLNYWIENPQTEIATALSKNSKNEVTNELEAKLICDALEIIKRQIQVSFDEKIENNISELTDLFQAVNSTEAKYYLNDRGIPLLIEILEIIKNKNYVLKRHSSCEIMIVQMLATYNNEKGIQKLSELIIENFKKDDYLWSFIFTPISEDEKKYNSIINGLNGKFPSGFLGISLLDMCNTMAIHSNTYAHPFNTQEGFSYLDDIIKNSSSDEDSYIISATTSIPFLAKEFQNKLFELVNHHKNINVQIEAAWAGAKNGNEEYIDKLVRFAKDYRYSSLAVSYLKELNLDNKIPREIYHPDFQALSEMCEWLSYPTEFEKYPDDAVIFDKRNIYWPPTKDFRTIYLIKYTYKNYNEDGSDKTGIGLVGSVTFSFFSINNILKLKPIEILAIHCNWELKKEKYEDIKSGIALLKKYNKDIK